MKRGPDGRPRPRACGDPTQSCASALFPTRAASGSPSAIQNVARSKGSAAWRLTGPASGLYQLLWNRCDPAAAGVTVSGDARLAQSWRDGMHVRWN